MPADLRCCANRQKRLADVIGNRRSWQPEALAVPDHGRDAGKRYPLASLLLIAVAARVSGRRDRLGIVRWGRSLPTDLFPLWGTDPQ
jgi:hypothetical protein